MVEVEVEDERRRREEENADLYVLYKRLVGEMRLIGERNSKSKE